MKLSGARSREPPVGEGLGPAELLPGRRPRSHRAYSSVSPGGGHLGGWAGGARRTSWALPSLLNGQADFGSLRATFQPGTELLALERTSRPESQGGEGSVGGGGPRASALWPMESSGTQGTLSQGTTPIFFIIMVITSLAEALISPNLIPDLPTPLHLPDSAGAWEETLAPASESAPDPVLSLALPCLLPSSLGTLAPVPSSVQPGPGSALPGFSLCGGGGGGGGFRPGSASSAKV